MGKKKILIIDFDRRSLASLYEILSEEGYSVAIAADGKSGWDKFLTEEPNLVIIEPMLSKLHGFELCQKITCHREKRAPVFIITGVYKDYIYKSEGLRTYGASEYFEKPLDMREFMAAIKRVLPLPKVEPRNGPVPAGPSEKIPQTLPHAVSLKKEKSADDIPSLDDLRSLVAGTGAGKDSISPPGDSNPRRAKKDKIDEMIQSALSDFDLGAEKRKAKKTARSSSPKAVAPPPPQKPRPPDPVVAKSKPLHPIPDQEIRKSAPSLPHPAAGQARTPPSSPPESGPRPTKPQVRLENRLVFGPPPMSPSPFPQAPEKAAPVSPPRRSPEKLEPAPPQPSRPSQNHKHAPVRESSSRKSEVIITKQTSSAETSTVSQIQAVPSMRLFEDIHQSKKKLRTTVTVVAIIIIAVLSAFTFLRPKERPQKARTTQNALFKPVPSTPVEKAKEEQSPSGPEENGEHLEASPPAVPPEEKPQQTPAKPPAEQAVLAPALEVPIKPVSSGMEIQLPDEKKNEELARETPAQESQSPPIQAEAGQPSGNGNGTNGDASTPAETIKAKPGDLVPLEEVDVPPQPLKRTDPVYPTRAFKFGLEGSVTVNALVSEDGDVIDTGIMKGLKDDLGLEKAAENAVKKWKFRPATKDGVPVKVWNPVVIVFKVK